MASLFGFYKVLSASHVSGKKWFKEFQLEHHRSQEG